MILFLDFDGVLHPIPCKHDELLCFVPRLQAVLRKFPDVQVVISSMWRHSHTLDQLRDYFSPDIWPRIVGVTPSTETPTRREYDALEDIGFMFPQTRHAEILQWIADKAYTGPWVALDDAWREFPDPCLQLLRCETEEGLTEARAIALSVRFAAYL